MISGWLAMWPSAHSAVAETVKLVFFVDSVLARSFKRFATMVNSSELAAVAQVHEIFAVSLLERQYMTEVR